MQMNRHLGKWIATALLTVSCLPTLHAQDSNNILGLPAIPQGPAGSSSTNKTPAAPGGLVEPSDGEIKSMLSGSMGMASSYLNDQITIRVTTAKTFTGDKTRRQILQAARLVQRDVGGACGKLCKAALMPAPRFQADNTLTFDIVIQGYAGLLSTTDMVNLVSGNSISPAQAPAPTPAPAAPAKPAKPVMPAAAAKISSTPAIATPTSAAP